MTLTPQEAQSLRFLVESGARRPKPASLGVQFAEDELADGFLRSATPSPAGHDGHGEFVLSPAQLAWRASRHFALLCVEAECANSADMEAGGSAADTAFDLDSRGSSSSPTSPGRLFAIEEEEISYLSAMKLLSELGPEKLQADAAWRTYVLGEKVRIARAMDRHRMCDWFCPSLEELQAKPDVEVWPEMLQPVGGDPVFNFAALEQAEQECHDLLQRPFDMWRKETHRSRAAKAAGAGA